MAFPNCKAGSSLGLGAFGSNWIAPPLAIGLFLSLGFGRYSIGYKFVSIVAYILAYLAPNEF